VTEERDRGELGRNGHMANGSGPDRNGSNPEGGSGDSREEMHGRTEIDAHAEQVLRGEAPQGADPALVELAAFAAELRSAYVRPPSDEARERHLAAIVVEAARTEDSPPAAAGGRGFRLRELFTDRRPSLAVRAAAIGAVALVGTASLAVAGVKPPAPLNSAFERVGISASDGSKDRAPANDTGVESDPGELQQGPDLDRARTNDASPSSTPARPGGSAPRGERGGQAGAVGSKPRKKAAGKTHEKKTPPTSPGRGSESRPESTPPAPPAPPKNGKGSAKGGGPPAHARGKGGPPGHAKGRPPGVGRGHSSGRATPGSSRGNRGRATSERRGQAHTRSQSQPKPRMKGAGPVRPGSSGGRGRGRE
jgi:hypothetical protein